MRHFLWTWLLVWFREEMLFSEFRSRRQYISEQKKFSLRLVHLFQKKEESPQGTTCPPPPFKLCECPGVRAGIQVLTRASLVPPLIPTLLVLWTIIFFFPSTVLPSSFKTSSFSFHHNLVRVQTRFHPLTLERSLFNSADPKSEHSLRGRNCFKPALW